MKNFFYFLLTFTISNSFATHPLTIKEIKELGYFDKLDYTSEEVRAQMPTFEARLFQETQRVSKFYNVNPYFKDNALIFIYTALYMDNNLEAYKHQYLSFRDLTSQMQLSNSENAEDEIKARAAKIIEYVDRAKELLADDIRIDSWVYGMKAKHVDTELYVSKIVQFAQAKKDTFSLVSALTITHDKKVTPEQEKILTKLVKKFSSINSPCFSGKTKSQCRSTELAPFAAQTGVVMLADYRFKSSLKEKGEFARRMGRILSESLYRSTHQFWMKDSTPFWRNKNLVSDRLLLTHDKNIKHNVVDEKFRRPENTVIFQCSSCHDSGK